jgi:DNA-binding NtrC family response regulator
LLVLSSRILIEPFFTTKEKGEGPAMGLTGDQLARAMMQIRSDIPVILCTGFGARIKEEKSLAPGIRAFITKPVLKRQIGETVRKVLDDASGLGSIRIVNLKSRKKIPREVEGKKHVCQSRAGDCVVIQKSAQLLSVMPDLIRHPGTQGLETELDSGSSPE